LDDVTVTINSNCERNVNLFGAGQDTTYFINIHPYQKDVPLIVPAGNYDVTIFPNDAGVVRWLLREQLRKR
jgi:hypothetical protein